MAPKIQTLPTDPMATLAAVMNAAAVLQQFVTIREGRPFVLVPLPEGVTPEALALSGDMAAMAVVEEVRSHTAAATATRAQAHEVIRGKFGPGSRGKQKRRFGRARYVAKLHHRQKVENLTINNHPLAPVQAKLMAFAQKKGKEGFTAQEAETYLGRGDRKKGHGPFSSTKHALMEAGLLEAREDEAIAS
jgi:hypothetical protein